MWLSVLVSFVGTSAFFKTKQKCTFLFSWGPRVSLQSWVWPPSSSFVFHRQKCFSYGCFLLWRSLSWLTHRLHKTSCFSFVTLCCETRLLVFWNAQQDYLSADLLPSKASFKQTERKRADARYESSVIRSGSDSSWENRSSSSVFSSQLLIFKVQIWVKSL